jgi:hypothetical protein
MQSSAWLRNTTPASQKLRSGVRRYSAVIESSTTNVPNFKFYRRIIECHGLSQKSGSNSWFLKFKEFIAHKAHHQARFADGRVAQQNQLEMVHAGVATAAAA